MGLEYCYNSIVKAIVWDTNKAVNIGEWSICGGDQLERFYCHIDTYILPTINIYKYTCIPHSSGKG